jgi:hypothetical protein
MLLRGLRPVACSGICLFDPQAVSDSQFRHDVCWSLRIVFQFPTKRADVHTQEVTVHGVPWPPHLPEELLVSQYLPGCMHEHFEQIVLGRGQLQNGAPHFDQPTCQVNFELTKAEWGPWAPSGDAP